VKPSKPTFWALIGLLHGVIVTFRLPEQNALAFLISGALYSLLWLAISALTLKLMKSKYRVGVGLLLLASGFLIFIGSFTNYDPITFSLGVLQLIMSIPLLLPIAIRAIKNRNSNSD
jgi:hypothetical protein